MGTACILSVVAAAQVGPQHREMLQGWCDTHLERNLLAMVGNFSVFVEPEVLQRLPD